ncbi:hypothetical protein EJ08DRAFT_701913 [Tothia fuscella]|uniref:NACHT domain-containing protein n=1 Tax=Tothia fuscella TaxID=1048955 RepID=A0A9P4NHV7_9PEZI|nr:hypothetical protein EJ08DRAFT_701913 [Tothia fuscella]
MARNRASTIDEFVGLGLLMVGELRCINDVQDLSYIKNVVQTFIIKLEAVIFDFQTASTADSTPLDLLSCASLRLARDLLIRVDLFWSRLQGIADLNHVPVVCQTIWPVENLRILEDRLLKFCASSKFEPGPVAIKGAGLYGPIVDPKSHGLQNQDKARTLEEFFLDKLAFKSMKDREDEVSPAHFATFEWILEKPLSDDTKSMINVTSRSIRFAEWLCSNDTSGIFWIKGKAGSGKSTLMRYICQHQKTTKFLDKWTSDKPLTTVSFYFWTSGTPEQRSQTVLLRYHLHQLLSQGKEMIPWVFPELWLRCQDTKSRVAAVLDWSTELLVYGFQKFFKNAAGKTRICLFIDGLDGLEGDQRGLIELVRFIVDLSSDFKILVSSRPWPIFEKAFSDVPNLQLQVLSKGDIRQYIDKYLDGVPEICHIASRDSDRFSQFKSRITQKADGVFLWATLCTKALIARLADGDTVADLDAKLAQFPADLDDFYRYLLFTKRPHKELQEQSRILQIIRARETVCDFTKDESSSSMIAYQLVLAIQGEALETNTDVKQLSTAEVMDMYQTLRTQLTSLCADLVVLHSSESSLSRSQGASFLVEGDIESRRFAQSRVGYYHRTVRDFLIFKSTLDWYWLPRKLDPLDNWARNAFATYELRMKHNTPYHCPFLSLAAEFGLHQYVEAEIKTARYEYKGGIPPLSHGIEFLASRRHSVYPLLSTELISILLDSAHDPNILYKDLSGKDTTPRLLALKYVREAHQRGWIQIYDLTPDGNARWVGTLKLFILHGADPNALIVEDSWDLAVTALDIVTEMFQTYLSHDFKQLLQILVEKGAVETALNNRTKERYDLCCNRYIMTES